MPSLAEELQAKIVVDKHVSGTANAKECLTKHFVNPLHLLFIFSKSEHDLRSAKENECSEWVEEPPHMEDNKSTIRQRVPRLK